MLKYGMKALKSESSQTTPTSKNLNPKIANFSNNAFHKKMPIKKTPISGNAFHRKHLGN